MKYQSLFTLLSVCALAVFLSCDVGVQALNDAGGGQGNPQADGGRDSDGSATEKDGGGAGTDGGGECPAIAPALPCKEETDCPSGQRCEPMLPDRPACGSGCISYGADGGTVDGGEPATCTDLDFCGCSDRSDCEVMSNGCICGCDYQCPGHSPCVCGCGGGDYLGCKDQSDPNPCGAGGFCRSDVMSSCGDTNFEAAPGLYCALDDGGTGYCCMPVKTCEKDPDCPGCEMCEMTRVGPRTCVEPVSGGQRCNENKDCSPYYRCAAPLMTDKPECGGVCVYDNVPDAGYPDAGRPDAGHPDAGTGVGGPGSKCADSTDCNAGGCLPEKSGYPTGGYCAGPVCDLFGNPGDCPADAICLPMDFSQAAALCMAACKGDSDCRDGLTCEAMPISQRYYGQPYFCWQSGASLGKGLGEACKDGTECITRYCEASGSGSVKVCSAFCSKEYPCKLEQVCATSPNCRPSTDCGMCVYPIK